MPCYVCQRGALPVELGAVGCAVPRRVVWLCGAHFAAFSTWATEQRAADDRARSPLGKAPTASVPGR